MVLDGKKTIGGTKILVHNKGHGLLLDFGLNFAEFGKFFEEFLRPRSILGLRDYWQLGLIPPYPSLYQPELVLGSFSNAQELPVKMIDGLVLSHAHIDHFGMAGVLNLDIPVISSSATLAMLRAYQDSSKSEFCSEAAYASPFETSTCRSHKIIETGDWRKCPHKGRNAVVMEGKFTEELANLWQRKKNPDGSGRGMNSGEIDTIDNSKLDWDIKAFPVDHSVPGACATIIKCGDYVIAYTGDMRFSGCKASCTDEFVKQAKQLGVNVLITEGTQVAGQNKCSTTEKECKENSDRVIESAGKKLVIADFSAKNIERLVLFADIAAKNDRRLVILPKDALLLNYLQTVEEDLPMPSDSLLVYDAPKGKDSKWEDWIYDTYSHYSVSASEIASAPEEYVVAFSFLDMKHLNDIKPDGGIYIYSSSEPHDEEQLIDFKRLYNWLSFYKFKIIGFQYKKDEAIDNINVEMESGYHCSGHMSSEEIGKVVREIEPDILIPVHTTDPKWFKKEFEKDYKVLV